jgi:hypothetical protein
MRPSSRFSTIQRRPEQVRNVGASCLNSAPKTAEASVDATNLPSDRLNCRIGIFGCCRDIASEPVFFRQHSQQQKRHDRRQAEFALRSCNRGRRTLPADQSPRRGGAKLA